MWSVKQPVNGQFLTKMADQMSEMADHHFDLLLFWEPGWVFLQLPAFLGQGSCLPGKTTTLFLAGCSNHGYHHCVMVVHIYLIRYLAPVLYLAVLIVYCIIFLFIGILMDKSTLTLYHHKEHSAQHFYKEIYNLVDLDQLLGCLCRFWNLLTQVRDSYSKVSLTAKMEDLTFAFDDNLDAAESEQNPSTIL